jgi:hypothetical protein
MKNQTYIANVQQRNADEHLDAIVAKSKSLLEICAKRTPGEWRFSYRGYRANTVSVPDQPNRERPEFDSWINLNYDGGFADGTFIASAAENFESALRTTITQIEWLKDDMQAAEQDGDFDCVRALKRRADFIRAEWPVERLK